MTHPERYSQEGWSKYSRAKWGTKRVSRTAENTWGYSGSQTRRCHFQKMENLIPEYILRSVVCRTREVIILLYLLVVRAWFPLWAQHLKKYGCRDNPTESEKNKVFKKPWSLKNGLVGKRGWGKGRRVFQFTKGYYNRDSDQLLSVSSGGGQEVICLICSKEDLDDTLEKTHYGKDS